MRSMQESYKKVIYQVSTTWFYGKKKISEELASAVHHFRKLINSFHKDHPDKPNATSLAIDIIPLMVRLIVKPIEPPK